MEDAKLICLEGEVLDNARFDFNSVLNRTLREMLRLGVLDGSVTMKVSIELTPAADAQTGRAIIMPKLTHKIGSNMKIVAAEEAGSAQTAGCELVIDEKTGEVGLVRIDDGQCSLMED